MVSLVHLAVEPLASPGRWHCLETDGNSPHPGRISRWLTPLCLGPNDFKPAPSHTCWKAVRKYRAHACRLSNVKGRAADANCRNHSFKVLEAIANSRGEISQISQSASCRDYPDRKISTMANRASRSSTSDAGQSCGFPLFGAEPENHAAASSLDTRRSTL